jgi:hypothetical protein
MRTPDGKFQKGERTAGRTPGTPNKATHDVQVFIDRVFAQVDPDQLAVEFLNCEDRKVAAMIFKTLIEYRYGKATEHIHVTGMEGLADRIREGRQRAGTKFSDEDDRQS